MMQMNMNQQPMTGNNEGETRERLCYTVDELMDYMRKYPLD